MNIYGLNSRGFELLDFTSSDYSWGQKCAPYYSGLKAGPSTDSAKKVSNWQRNKY